MKRLKIPQLCFMLVSIWGTMIFPAVHAKDYIDIEWTQLIPADDLAALMNPPDFIVDIEDGTAQDNVGALSELGDGNEVAMRFQAALQSNRVIDAFNDQNIRLPGFIVPIASDENQQVTAFFIVPYFGACLHLPPPPPNQIIYVEYAQGIAVPNIQAPFWFAGTMIIDQNENELGTSAYTMQIDSITPYEG